MKSLLIVFSLALMLLTNSCQDFNSNTFDEFRFVGFDLTTIEGRAMKVINDKCSYCHTHAAWAGEKFRVDLAGGSDQTWITAGLIDQSGDYTTSEIIQRLKNFPGGDMPVGDSELTQGELDDLCAWIEGSAC